MPHRPPRPVENRELADRLLLALELMDDGLRLKRAAIRREHPTLSARERREIYRAWLLRRPEDVG